jgi:hypothetical protein
MTGRIIAIALATILIVFVICQPEQLYKNTFVNQLASVDVLSLFAVILTVTLAAVASIIVSINRIVLMLPEPRDEAKAAAAEVKKQVKRSDWIIFWGFILAAIALILKGFFPANIHIVSSIHAFIIWMLALYCLSLYDIYSVLFAAIEKEI